MSKKAARTYVSGKQVNCPFCGHDYFFRRDIKLNTTGMSFFGFDWLNQSAKALVCAECGRIEWFLTGDIRYEE